MNYILRIVCIIFFEGSTKQNEIKFRKWDFCCNLHTAQMSRSVCFVVFCKRKEEKKKRTNF
jgi:hypothetical protein